MKRQTEANCNAPAVWSRPKPTDLSFGYFEYDGYFINIYEHPSNQNPNISIKDKTFYFEPLNRLVHNSASSFENVDTGFPIMRFRIEMWSDSLKNAAVKEISKILVNSNVNKYMVHILPIERVMILEENNLHPSKYEIQKKWIIYRREQFIEVDYNCATLEDCGELKTIINSHANHVNLKMMLLLPSQESRNKRKNLKIESIMVGDMMKKLEQKNIKGKKVLITADVKKSLLKELSNNIILQMADYTHDIPSECSLVTIYDVLEKMLQITPIETQNDKETWETVFWDEASFRPDVSAKYINELYEKLSKDNQVQLEKLFTQKDKMDFGASGSGWDANIAVREEKFTSHIQLFLQLVEDAFSLRSGQDFNKLLSKSKNLIEWNGKEFSPKNFELYEVNMADLKTSLSVHQTTYIEVKFTKAQSFAVRYHLTSDFNTSSILLKIQQEIRGKLPVFVFSFRY